MAGTPDGLPRPRTRVVLDAALHLGDRIDPRRGSVSDHWDNDGADGGDDATETDDEERGHISHESSSFASATVHDA